MQNEQAEGQVKSKHRGVSIQPLTDERWRLRWRMPGGKQREKILQGKRSVAVKFAVYQAGQLRVLRDKLRGRKLDIEMGKTVAPLDEQRVEIEAECRTYYSALVNERKAGDTMQHAAEVSADLLKAWCSEQGLTYLDQLTLPMLLAWRQSLFARRKPKGVHRGEAYKVSMINQWLKPVRTMLRAASTEERYALGHDKIAKGLKHTPVVKKTARTKHRIKQARALDVVEIRATLEAARAYDARDRALEQGPQVLWAARPLAGDIANLLLDGLRRVEYTRLKCADAYCDRAEGWTVNLPDELAKGGVGRKIYSRGFTVVGAKLLEAMRGERGDDEWLSHWEYQALGRAVKRLRKLGAPKDLTVHVLRATCATYQTGVAGVDPHRAVRRLGHGIQVAHDDYIDPPAGMKFGAASIEDAMDCVDLFEQVLADVRAYAGEPRTETRVRRRKACKQTLLAKPPGKAAPQRLAVAS